MDLSTLFRDMALARRVELALAELWRRGLISGELHLGTGEEAVAAGVCRHLRDGDALALDHRPTPFMALRGVGIAAMIRECMGLDDGLCGGRGGHMHLFAPDKLAASSGIVGSSGPLATGFALAGKHLRPRSIAVATFGDGAVNQGMLMESFNLAVAWKLPVLFVCKDNRWAITTESRSVTGGDIAERASAFGMPVASVDGLDPCEVYDAAGGAVERARRGGGPSFLLASCSRLDGHMLGDALQRVARSPLGEGRATLGHAVSEAMSARGGSVLGRAASLVDMTVRMQKSIRDRVGGRNDPVERARKRLGREAAPIDAEVRAVVEQALAEAVA